MTTKKKGGIFRGLGVKISQIFADEKEDEIEIGFPTDVKHVAHIGMDGPSANTPSWMTEFKGDVSTISPSSAQDNPPKTQDNNKKSSKPQRPKDVTKSRHSSIDNIADSPTRKGSDGPKNARRQRSSDPTSESTVRESPAGGGRQSRRIRNPKVGPDSTGDEASPPVNKPGRRRKSKVTSADGSEKTEKSSRRSSKGDSLTDISLPDLDSVIDER